ncbi:hypothetical protein V8E55_001208 [Tylopilus felleus]
MSTRTLSSASLYGAWPRLSGAAAGVSPGPESGRDNNTIKRPPARQRLVDDIIALYSCQPTTTIERVKRYSPDCVYDDQFAYANNRYKMAGQWFALPKLFKDSEQERRVRNTVDSDFIQVKYHKDQANDKDYSHQGVAFSFKKWQADNVEDQHATTEEIKKYGTGKEEGDPPK